MMDSVDVLHALLLLVTCPPAPSKPPSRALTALDITRSGTVLPNRRTRAESVIGTSTLPAVSSPPMPEPKMIDVSQSGRVRVDGEARIFPTVQAGDAAHDRVAIHAELSRRVEVAVTQTIETFGHTRHLAAKTEFGEFGTKANSRASVA